MYSRFSKKEIVALAITGITTLVLASVLFSANASTATTEDFLSGLEKAFPKIGTGTATSTGTTTPPVTPTRTGSTGTTTPPVTPTRTGSAVTTTPPVTPTRTGSTVATPPVTPPPTRTGSAVTTTPPVTTKPPVGATTNFGEDLNKLIENTYQGVTTTPPATVGGSSSANTVTNAGLNSADQCKLPAIEILQVEEQDTKTIVRWKEVATAIGYDVMKRSNSGQFVFIERVKNPIYTAHLARGAVKYEDFKIAAVCGATKSASINTSKVTRIKTGPTQLLLLLLLSMNIWAAIMLRKKFVKKQG